MSENTINNKIHARQNVSVDFLTKVAILGAVSFIMMMFEFPLPVAPSFYKIDFSEVAVLVGGFALGPGAAVCIEALKVALNLIFHGTTTMGVGEFANFLIGCAMCVPATLMYQKVKTKSSAIKGLVIGTLCMTFAGIVLNYFLLIPAFVMIAHYPMEAIIAMGNAIYPFVNGKLSLVIACVTPFNLIKGVAVSVLTVLLYKHVSPILHH